MTETLPIKRSFAHKLAAVVSWIFQPLLMPLFGITFLLSMPVYQISFMPSQVKWFVLASITLFSVILPILGILLMKRFGLIESIMMDKREDRSIPTIFTLVCFFINYWLLTRLQLPVLFYTYMLAGILSLLFGLMITRHWKVSMHMIGVGGLCGLVILTGLVWPVSVGFSLGLSLILAGFVGTSRVMLGAHIPSQVYVGFGIGFFPQILLWVMVLFK